MKLTTVGAVFAVFFVWQWSTTAPAFGAVAKSCNGQAATIIGTRFADRIIGTPHRDVIVAGPGPDRVFGRGGDDIICGGFGRDILYAGYQMDRVFGGPGRDTLIDRTQGVGDLLNGGPGDDLLRSGGTNGGLNSDRTLMGGTGDDRVVSVLHGDVLRGNAGRDHLVTLDFARMAGGDGKDVVRLLGPAVARLRGDGDTVRIGDSVHVAILSYRSAPGPVQIDLQAGYGHVIGHPHIRDQFVGLTNPEGTYQVEGTNGNDVLLGSNRVGEDGEFSYRDGLDGLAGDDVLDGRDGPDFLWGREGDDQLDGGLGSDLGSGGPGADTCLNIEWFYDDC